MRIWVRPGQDESIVMFQFHHACTDGVGFLAFCEDLLAAYAAVHPDGPRVALRPLNPQRLIGRGVLGIPQRSRWQQVYDALTGIREGLRFVLQAPWPLAPKVEPGRAAGHVVFRSYTFTDDTVVQLRRLAGQAEATLNDVLLRDLMIALRRWQTASGRAPGAAGCAC